MGAYRKVARGYRMVTSRSIIVVTSHRSKCFFSISWLLELDHILTQSSTEQCVQTIHTDSRFRHRDVRGVTSRKKISKLNISESKQDTGLVSIDEL